MIERLFFMLGIIVAAGMIGLLFSLTHLSEDGPVASVSIAAAVDTLPPSGAGATGRAAEEERMTP